jgi:AcrR family transcriptional regulator
MEGLNIKIRVDEVLFSKNPDSSILGKKIISNSINLIDTLGFEKFTFKKLSIQINSPESSIYRYFENKHSLLLYLTNWYWARIEYRIVLATLNVKSPKEQLKNALKVLTKPVLKDNNVSYVNEVLLYKIIVTESVKAFHTKAIDDENQKGCFNSYKKVISRVSALVRVINPSYNYANMLITTVLDGAQQQYFYAEHLPKLIDGKGQAKEINNFFEELVFNTITKNDK